MEEKIIDFETAKLVKEKRFDESCIGLYWSDGKYDYEEDYLFHKRKDTYPALKQSLLQRWLREKHNIHIKIDYFLDLDDNTEWDFEIVYIGTDLDEKGEYIPVVSYHEERSFISYEEALEKGLYESLKLIK